MMYGEEVNYLRCRCELHGNSLETRNQSKKEKRGRIEFDKWVLLFGLGTAVAQWLRCCATHRKVAGSIPACVSGFFIDVKSFRSHYDHGVDSTSNVNEYQEYFLGVKAACA